MIKFRLCVFDRNITEVMLCSLSGVDFSPITGEVNFDHLVKVVSSKVSSVENYYFILYN